MLAHTEDRFRMDLVASWLAAELQAAMEGGVLRKWPPMGWTINGARSLAEGLSQIELSSQPNLWSALMKIVVDLLILMYVVGLPVTTFSYGQGIPPPPP